MVALEDPEIKVSYNVVKKDKSTVQMFLSASGRANYVFLREFHPYFEQIKKKVKFEPFYFTT